mmetsp:Transcript_23804/g.54383  ORF Transcript_23804/g.54383 Transcript_23804/m.54383 type:complete len:212 (-) Transcript_23804:25-660(-)
MRRPLRTRLPAALLLLSLALALVCSWESAFVGAPAGPAQERGELVAVHSSKTRAAGMHRRQATFRKSIFKVPVRGREVSALYRDILGAEKNEPEEMNDVAVASSAKKGTEVNLEIQRYPSGILQYNPGQDWKGAVVKLVDKPYYPNDPSGQAAEAGVEPGMVVKSINGQDMLTADFDDIMKAMGDSNFASVFGPSRVKLPLLVTFAKTSVV